MCYFYCEGFLSFLIVQIFAYMYPRSFAPVLFGSSSMSFCIFVPFPCFFFIFFCNTRLRSDHTRGGPCKFNMVVTSGTCALCCIFDVQECKQWGLKRQFTLAELLHFCSAEFATFPVLFLFITRFM